jgi:hypothetical protein
LKKFLTLQPSRVDKKEVEREEDENGFDKGVFVEASKRS